MARAFSTPSYLVLRIAFVSVTFERKSFKLVLYRLLPSTVNTFDLDALGVCAKERLHTRDKVKILYFMVLKSQ